MAATIEQLKRRWCRSRNYRVMIDRPNQRGENGFAGRQAAIDPIEGILDGSPSGMVGALDNNLAVDGAHLFGEMPGQGEPTLRAHTRYDRSAQTVLAMQIIYARREQFLGFGFVDGRMISEGEADGIKGRENRAKPVNIALAQGL